MSFSNINFDPSHTHKNGHDPVHPGPQLEAQESPELHEQSAPQSPPLAQPESLEQPLSEAHAPLASPPTLSGINKAIPGVMSRDRSAVTTKATSIANSQYV